MAEVTKGSRRINALLLVLGAGVWSFNTYKMVTGLQSMELGDGLASGMCFFIGPFILFESFKAVREGKG